MNNERKIAVIAGAGPAGLTAAHELLEKTGIQPVIFETAQQVGGLCRTVNHHGNRMDLGGHRFFSKSDRVLEWWNRFLPVEKNGDGGNGSTVLSYQNKTHRIATNGSGPSAEATDKVTLVRTRRSRIFYAEKFFDYPLNLNASALRKLGLRKTIKLMMSYFKSLLFPIRPEKTLEDFYVNRFGRELYSTFFKSYTKKVWGVESREINSEWGSQRIRGLNLFKTLLHPLKKLFSTTSISGEPGDLLEKNVETSLIQRFLYPKFGPGQLWEEVGHSVEKLGGRIHLSHSVVKISVAQNRVTEVWVRDELNEEIKPVPADYFLSTMPIRDLIAAMGEAAPEEVRFAAEGLRYRDFIVVGVLLKKLSLPPGGTTPDNWIYIQDDRVQVGRIQIFNNWSPYLVKDPSTVWIGMEYFCNEGDPLWKKSDRELSRFAADELEKLGFAQEPDIMDTHVERVQKAYPSYFGSYDKLDVIRKFTDGIENLFLIGRNGMHKYNNQDHSMLAAMECVENIARGETSKENIWAVNADKAYHEEK